MQMFLSLILDTLLWSTLCCFTQNWTTNIPHITVLMGNKKQLLNIAKPFSQVEETIWWRNSFGKCSIIKSQALYSDPPWRVNHTEISCSVACISAHHY